MDQHLKPYTREIGKLLYVTTKTPAERVQDHQFDKWLAAVGTFVIWLAGVYTFIKLSLTFFATWPALPFVVVFIGLASWYLVPRVRKLYAADILVVGDKGITRIWQRYDGQVLKARTLLFNEALNFEYQIKQDYSDLRIQQGKTRWYMYANKDASQESIEQLKAAYDAMCLWKAKQRLLNDKTQPVIKP